MSKYQGSLENETDDIFEEIAVHRIKTEKEQVQSEDNDVSKGRNSSYTVKYPVMGIGHNLSNVNEESYHIDVENNTTGSSKCLKHEDPDDVFDEEREKGVKGTVKDGISFDNFALEVKIEVDEDNGINHNSQDNFSFLANAVKQEYDVDGNFNDSLIEDVATNETVSVHDEHHVKPEVDIESQRARLEKNNPEMLSPSRKKCKNAKIVAKKIENEKSLDNKDGGITNIDNHSQHIQSIVEDRDKQPVLKSLSRRVKHAIKEADTQKNKVNNDLVKLKEQNRGKKINTKSIIENTDRRETEVENLRNATSNEQHSYENNEQQGEHVRKSCRFENAKQMENGMENISKKKQSNLKQNSPKIDFQNESNSKISNAISSNCQAICAEIKKKKRIKRKGLFNRKRRTNLKKQFVGKAKIQNPRELSLNTSVNIDKPEKNQGENDLAVTLIESKESCKDTITEIKEKTQTDASQIETSSSMELPEFGNKSVSKSSQTETERILEICEKNTAVLIEESKELQSPNVDYVCTKCPFKAKRKAIMKRHLLKHGIEFSSTITSFFDIIKKAKLYTSQLEQIYVEKEPQTKVVIQNNQGENEVNNEEKNDSHLEKKVSGNIHNSALQTQNVEMCANVSSRINTRSNSCTLVNKNGDEVSNTENQTPTESEQALAINARDKIVGRPAYIIRAVDKKNVPMEKSCSSESEQSVKDAEIGSVNYKTNPSMNIEYSCTKCQFKTKHRALLKTHLIAHGEELASGIITFLDIVKNEKVHSNRFRSDSEHKEEQTRNTGENIEAQNKADIFDDAIQHTVDSDALSTCEEKMENGQSCKTDVENGNGNIEIDDNNVEHKDRNIDREHTESIVLNESEEEETLPLNKNTTSTNLDKSENKVNGNECIEIPSANKAKLKRRTKRKRKRAVGGTFSPTKKIKLQVNDEKIYYCDQCSYQSNKRKNFNEHRFIHSTDVVKCGQCEFVTNLKRNLNNHMLIHLKPEEIKLHKCPNCPYQTKRSNDLRIHMVKHRKPEEAKMFKCDKCPYQSIRKGNLKSHQLYHKSADEVALFTCAVCSFKSKEKSSLKKHMIRHQKEEDILWYKCELCSFTSKFKSGLTKHCVVHKSHDEIKTYDCPTCSYRAKHKSHLDSHLLLHKDLNEVKMHECIQCSYKSVRKTNLLAHVLLQHKTKEEINMAKCDHCPFETKLRGNLVKHVRRRHKLQQ